MEHADEGLFDSAAYVNGQEVPNQIYTLKCTFVRV